MKLSPPRIALTMIVRDEERSLSRALTSAAPLVDDIVVVDTGSVDDTVAVAVAHGARVSHFTWIDDFAAARNCALAHAESELALVLDADEWVDSDDESVLRRWALGAGPGVAGEVTVLSESDSDGDTLTAQVDSVRVLPRGSWYVGRIHEQPTGYASLTAIPGMHLRHEGYRAAQLERKKGRNERILRQLLSANPDDPYLQFQYGRERQIAGAFGEAADAYLTALPHVDEHTPWRDDIRSRVIFALYRAGRAEAALTTTTTFLGGPAGQSAEVLFAAGNLFLDLAIATPSRRHSLIPMARAAWQACLDVGEPTDGRDSTPGCGSFLAADNLAGLCAAEGDEAGRRRWAQVAASLRHAHAPVPR